MVFVYAYNFMANSGLWSLLRDLWFKPKSTNLTILVQASFTLLSTS